MQKIVAFGSPKGCATLSRVFHPNGEFTRAFVGAVRKVLEQSSGNQTHVKQFGLIRNTCPHLGDFRSWFSMFMLDVPAKDESRKISELTNEWPWTRQDVESWFESSSAQLVVLCQLWANRPSSFSPFERRRLHEIQALCGLLA